MFAEKGNNINTIFFGEELSYSAESSWARSHDF